MLAKGARIRTKADRGRTFQRLFTPHGYASGGRPAGEPILEPRIDEDRLSRAKPRNHEAKERNRT